MRRPLLIFLALGGIISAYWLMSRKGSEPAKANISSVEVPSKAAPDPSAAVPAESPAPVKPAPVVKPAPADPFALSAPAQAFLQQFQAAATSANAPTMLEIIASSRSLAPRDRSLFFGKIAPLIAKTSPAVSQEVIKTLHKQNPADGQSLGNLVVRELAKEDPKTAAAWVETLDPYIHARQFYQTIAHDWADQNHDETLAWINTLQDNLLNQSAAVEGLADSWGTKNLDELIAWAQKIDDSFIRGAALLKAAKLMAMTDPAGAAKLSLGFTDPLSQRQGLESSLRAWAATAKDPTEPQRFIEKIPDLNVKTEAQLAYITGLGRKDPAAAETYISQLPAAVQTQAKALIPESSAPKLPKP